MEHQVTEKHINLMNFAKKSCKMLRIMPKILLVDIKICWDNKAIIGGFYKYVFKHACIILILCGLDKLHIYFKIVHPLLVLKLLVHQKKQNFVLMHH